MFQHDIKNLIVDGPKRPMDWDAYLWDVVSKCSRCHQSLISEYLIPNQLLLLIPTERRDEAMQIMTNFARKRHAYAISQYANPELPLCSVQEGEI